MSSGSHGVEAEERTRADAGVLGVADFVFTVPVASKGSGTRELGDALLIVGTDGAIVQVKSRDRASAEADSTERANRWAQAAIDKAARQVDGTRRELSRRIQLGEVLRAAPQRAAHLPAAEAERYAKGVAGSVVDWPGIVVIDHPAADLAVPATMLILTLDDWTELQRRLGSISATIIYAQRIIEANLTSRLGNEVERYLSVYEADLGITNGEATTAPFRAHPDDFARRGWTVLNEFASRLWPHDNPIPWKEPDDYRRIVEFLDRVPPGMRARVGQGIADLMTRHRQSGEAERGLIFVGTHSQLVVWCDDLRHHGSEEKFGKDLVGLTWLRHTEAREHPNRPSDLTTLGLGMLRDGSDLLEVFAFCDLAEVFPTELRADAEKEYGRSPLPDGTK